MELNNGKRRDSIKKSTIKDSVLNLLDNDLIITFKKKIEKLENENNNLKEELNGLNRNFEALCYKSKDDLNLIKKLENELFYLKNNKNNAEFFISKNKENEDILMNYKEKVEQQQNIIKELEKRIVLLNGKINEKEGYYKSFISKLEIKMRSFEKENKELKLKNDENLKMFEENEKNFKKIKEIEENYEKQIQLKDLNLNELKQILEKLGKENSSLNKNINFFQKQMELSENLKKSLEEDILRYKKDLQLKENIIGMKEKELAENNEKMKKIQEKVKIMENSKTNQISLIEEMSCKLTEKDKIIEMLNSQISEKNEKIDKLSKISLNSIDRDELKRSLEVFISNAFLNSFYEIEMSLNQIEHKTKTKFKSFSEAFNLIKEKLKIIPNLNSKIKTLETAKSNNKEIFSLREQMFQQLLKLEEKEKTILKLYTELNQYKNLLQESESKNFSQKSLFEEKIQKKRKKIEKMKNLIQQQQEAISIQSTKLKMYEQDDIRNETIKSFNHIQSSLNKIKLSLETFIVMLNCKACSNLLSSSFVLKCGHTLCEKCFPDVIYCLECDNYNDKNVKIQNFFINQLVSRVSFINQTKEDIAFTAGLLSEKLFIK